MVVATLQKLKPTAAESLSRPDILPRVPILLLTALGALLRFYAIGRQGFWYDESYTALLVGRGPGEMLRLIPHLESTPPLYYCVAWVWARIFGFGPAGLKSLSALCGTLAIPVAYAAARKLLPSQRAAVIVAALTACNPFLIWYSQEARAYSMLVLMSALTLLAFAYARERPRPMAVALWAIACAAALLTHYYAVIVIVPQAAWLRVRAPPRTRDLRRDRRDRGRSVPRSRRWRSSRTARTATAGSPTPHICCGSGRCRPCS